MLYLHSFSKETSLRNTSYVHKRTKRLLRGKTRGRKKTNNLACRETAEGAAVALATAAVVGAADCTAETVGAEDGEADGKLVNDNNDGDEVGAEDREREEEEGGEEEEGLAVVGITGSVAVGAGVRAMVSDPTSTGAVSVTSTMTSSLPWPS